MRDSDAQNVVGLLCRRMKQEWSLKISRLAVMRWELNACQWCIAQESITDLASLVATHSRSATRSGGPTWSISQPSNAEADRS